MVELPRQLFQKLNFVNAYNKAAPHFGKAVSMSDSRRSVLQVAFQLQHFGPLRCLQIRSRQQNYNKVLVADDLNCQFVLRA